MLPDTLRARRIGKPPSAPAIPTDAESPDGVHLHLLTIAIALLSGVIFTIVEHNDAGHQHSNWCTVEIVIQSVVVLLGSWFARRHLMGANALIIPPLLVMAMLLSFLCEPIQRTLFGVGHPLEVLVMHCQSNLMLATATCGFRRSYRRLCAILSVFLTIFCLTKSTSPLILSLVAVYGVMAVAWLIASHWDQVSRRSIADGARRLPLGWLVALPAGLLVLFLASGREDTTDRLKGFMPSSGGTHDHDDHAHGGVHDGSDLIAGQDNIQSFGPIEDAPFADDDKPSLYDSFDDTYDEPLTRLRKIDRAIAVPPEQVVELQKRIAQSKQAGRQFSTLRRDNHRNRNSVHDLNSRALFYVAGRTPLHLRLETFDVFDGMDWFPSEDKPTREPPIMTHAGGRHWLRIPSTRTTDGLYSHRETHAIKIINLRGNVIPSPPQTDSVSIDLIDRTDMYEARNNGLVAMQRDNLPELTPIHVASNRLDAAYLEAGYGLAWVPRDRIIATSLPVHPRVRAIESLAAEWTKGLPRGPAAISAIVNQLRGKYTLDRETHADPDSDFPAADFLLNTRRGSEYMFATATALLLRSQGYPTRLVGGYYVRPEKYSPKKRHTPVHTRDAHFWCEVHIGSDMWMTVEPSPGYEILGPPPGLLSQIGTRVLAALAAIADHPILSLGIAAALVAAFWNRRRIIDLARTTAWRLGRPSNDQAFALGTLRLIEQRFRLVGIARPAGTTFGNWVASLSADFAHQARLSRFAGIADRAAFGSADLEPADRSLCEELPRELTFTSIRKYHATTRQKSV